MNLDQEALDRKWDEVRKAELAEIVLRREKAGLSGDQPPADNLTGLALSGGGIRSASFNLGVLQALVASGLFRYIDFLSTVSGGGYIGAFVSSLAYRQHLQRTHTKDTAAAATGYQPPLIAPKKDGSQADDTESLAKNSNFLNDKLELASRYLIGWFLNFVTLFTGLVFASAAIALVWRCLDMPFVVDFMTLYSYGWITEWNRPFLPALFAFGLWVLSWLWSSFWKGNVASARHSGKLLVTSAAFLLIGLAIFLGSPNMHLSASVGGDAQQLAFWNDHQHWLLPLLVGWLVTMLPFLNPVQLMKSGTDTKSLWRGWVFQIAGYAMIIGIPFATVWFIGRHNVSGIANRWDRQLVVSDVVDWEKFWKQMRDTDKPTWVSASVRDQVYKNGADQTKLLRYIREDTELFRLQRPNLSQLSDQEIGMYYTDLHAKHLIIALLNKSLLDIDLVADLMKAEKRERAVEERINNFPALLEDLAEQQRSGEKIKLTNGKVNLRENSLFDVIAAIRRAQASKQEHLAGELAKKEPADAESKDVIKTDQDYLAKLVQVNNEFAEYNTKPTPRKNYYAFLQDVRKKLAIQLHEPADAYAAAEARALLHIVDQYRFYTTDVDGSIDPNEPPNRFDDASKQWLDSEYKKQSANHLMLRLFYPQHLRPIRLTSRPFVIMPDQGTRLSILIVFGLLFIALGLIVNFNWTSMHGFYRRRIQRTFLVRHAMTDDDQEHREIELKALANTPQGYPYHILSGCVELVTDNRDVPSTMTAFQFTRLFCGGRELDFCATKDYRQGKMTLSSAAAISGAAVSPTRIRYLLLQVMLTLTNFRLGQWLPNPGKSNGLALPPRYVPLLRLMHSHLKAGGETRELAHVFVTDGGHYENLGIDMLLERRCRLIIASDTGADPTFEYSDVANLFVLAQHKGIRFVQFNPAEPGADQEITIESVQTKFTDGNYVAMWKVLYPEPDAKPGLCVYIKSSLPRPAPFEAGQFKLWNAEFPHDSTANQFFHEQQFEVYRSLGFHLAQNMLKYLQFDAKKQNDAPIDVDGLLARGVFA